MFSLYKKTNTDNSLIVLLITFLLFGILMIYNSTVIYSQDVFGGAYRFVFSQIAWIVLGGFGFVFFYRLDYKRINKVAYFLIILCVPFLVILALIGILDKIGILHCDASISFAPCINGARRWIYLNPTPLPKIPFLGILGFQPSELAKFSLILYLSVQLDKALKRLESPFLVFVIPTILISGLILLQPNMSIAVLIFIIGASMYFSSGANIKPLLIIMPILLLIGVALMFASPYRRERLTSYFDGHGNNDQKQSYHVQQIQIALGSGGLFGLGLGQSRQKFQYVPEVASDSIFAIMGEELGFIGTTVIIAFFSVLIYKGFSIAKKSHDVLGRLLAVGITTWIGIQFFINIAAMTNLIPLTGVPIPLVSYGGSSMIFTLMGIGVLANINKNQS